MPISLNDLQQYFAEYIALYRKGYEKFISVPPNGPGYPTLDISPYLRKSEFEIYLANDGVVINQIGVEPEYEWFIAGGPAIKVDYEPSVTPKEIKEKLMSSGLLGKNIGIYRIVAKKILPNKVWKGKINGIIRKIRVENIVHEINAIFYQVNASLKELLTVITFGAFGMVLDLPLPQETDYFGSPHLIRQIGIFPADLNNKRFFKYMEIYGHVDNCAWDRRSIELRIKSDLRRDFAENFANFDKLERRGGTLTLGSTLDWPENFTNRLINLKRAIDEFMKVLLFREDETENVFHKLLESNPILLDVYGKCESKPKLQYPQGKTSIIGKKYLEPDFIIIYPDQTYRLIEIERPSKNIVTMQGQPRAEFT